MLSGSGKPSDINVTSSLFVETVEKKQGAVKAKRFHGDASRVVAQGNGLKKAFAGRAATFTLEVKDAGNVPALHEYEDDAIMIIIIIITIIIITAFV